VFCRNVLIYFEQGVQERVVDWLRCLVAPDGYLFVGPAEAVLAAERGFCSAGYPMAFAFLRARPASAERVPLPASVGKASASRAAVLPALPSIATGALPRLRTVNRAPQVMPPDVTSENALVIARRLADEGKLAEAAQICEAYVRVHETSAAAWYLFGLVLDALGASERATEFYRRTVFLDPQHAEASMHLDLLRRQGRAAMAARTAS
jgi:chemotaxis protein methyltransferase WspC